MKLSTPLKIGAAAAGATLLAGEFFYEFVVNARLSAKITDKFGLSDPVTQEIFDNAPECIEGLRWRETVPRREVEILAGGGNKYTAYIIDADEPSHKWAISAHGYACDAMDQCVYAEHFHNAGFNVLLPDAGGHGRDSGRYTSMGAYDGKRVVAWAEYIADLDPDAQIVLHGQSMGGATVMIATGLKLPSQVRCAIEDCGYTTCMDEYKFKMRSMKVPPFPILYAANFVSKIRGNFDFNKCSPISSVARSVTPTLFIHGDSDAFVPFYMLDLLYNACTAEKQKLAIPGNYHATNAYQQPELYWKTVFDFVDRYFTDDKV